MIWHLIRLRIQYFIRRGLRFQKDKPPKPIYIISYVHKWGLDRESLKNELERWDATQILQTVWLLSFEKDDLDKMVDWEEWEIEMYKQCRETNILNQVFSRFLKDDYDGLVVARLDGCDYRFSGNWCGEWA